MKTNRRHQCLWGIVAICFGLSCGVSAADPLLTAIKNNDLAKVKELVAANPDCAKREIEYNSHPLTLAIDNFKPEIIKFLIEQGADVNAMDNRGNSPILNFAKLEGGYWTNLDQLKQVLQMLCDKKVDLNKYDKNGKSPLYILALKIHFQNTLANKLAIMQMMIDHGASVKTMQEKTVCPIGVAMLWDPYFVNNIEKSPAEVKAQYYRNLYDTLKLLLENGLDPNAADPNPQGEMNNVLITIMKAKPEVLSTEFKIELIKLFIDHGAEKNKKNKLGEKPERLLEGRDDPLAEVVRKYKPPRKSRR